MLENDWLASMALIAAWYVGFWFGRRWERRLPMEGLRHDDP